MRNEVSRTDGSDWQNKGSSFGGLCAQKHAQKTKQEPKNPSKNQTCHSAVCLYLISFSITILEGTSTSRLGSYVLYCLRCLRSLHPRPQTIYWNRSVPATWPRKMNGFSHPWRGYQGWAFAYYRNLFWFEKKHIKCVHVIRTSVHYFHLPTEKVDTKWCENSQ